MDGRESPDALCEEHVVGSQIDTQIELLYGAAQGAVHLEVRDHAARYRPLLLEATFVGLLLSEGVHLIHALPDFQLATLLALADVPAEVTIDLRLASF